MQETTLMTFAISYTLCWSICSISSNSSDEIITSSTFVEVPVVASMATKRLPRFLAAEVPTDGHNSSLFSIIFSSVRSDCPCFFWCVLIDHSVRNRRLQRGHVKRECPTSGWLCRMWTVRDDSKENSAVHIEQAYALISEYLCIRRCIWNTAHETICTGQYGQLR